MPSLVDHQEGESPSHLYVHVPFCTDRCVYCAFATQAEDAALHAAWLNGLLGEAGHRAHPLSVRTLYIGGGTPGLLSSSELFALFEYLTTIIDTTKQHEVSFEVNPLNVTRESIAYWSDIGIQRLSMGVQTTDNVALRSMGRLHDAADALQAMDLLRDHWKGAWSVDLIVGWRSSDPERLRRDVRAVLEFTPPHISIYGLTVEPRTPLARWVESAGGPLVPEAVLPEQDATWSGLLEEAGYERYEVSNFAKPGYRSLHNQAYWKNLPYEGWGPGASSSAGSLRWTNERDARRYAHRTLSGRSPRVRCERLDPEQRLIETLGSGLRTSDGLLVADLDARFSGAWREPVLAAGEVLLDDGRLLLDADRLVLPPGEMVRVDRILTELVHRWPNP